MRVGDMVTTASCQRGGLPETEYNIYCPLMGGRPGRNNYYTKSCLIRQREVGCRQAICPHRLKSLKKRAVIVAPANDRDSRERSASIQPEKQEESVAKKSVKACLECTEEKPICARGLCGACYARFSKEGTLDDRYPARKPQKVRADKGKAQPARNVPGSTQEEAVLPCGGEHSKGEECLPCSVCSRCREDLDSEGVCIDCGGVVEKYTPDRGYFSPFDRLAKACEDVTFAPVEGRPVALRSTTRDGVDVVRLEFLERDRNLLEYIEQWAADERRSLGDQILYVLDNIVFERNQEFAHLVVPGEESAHG